ncbi:hypothetical protein CUMW_024940 [Citrus unshiu]|nr:hypothetical protein CUMW_024940 [Citrus unshiu]
MQNARPTRTKPKLASLSFDISVAGSSLVICICSVTCRVSIDPVELWTREMKPEGLLASAVINIVLALIILTLFSILKKQPSVAPIYYGRRLSSIIQQNDRNNIPLLSFDHHHSFTRTLSRILPSFSWIPRAFRVTEEEILQTSGLDALIVIRLFKFGEDAPGRSPRSDHFLDSFSISNIGNDSNRLWVHFTCLWEYNEILIKRIQRLQSTRHRPDQFTVLVRQIPFCEEHGAHGCSVEHFFSKHHLHSYYSYQMLYTGKDLQDLLNQSRYMTRKIEDLREKTKKHYREPLLLEAMREDIEDIALHKEKFQELYQKMHQLQGDNMLKDMELPVAFVTFKSRWGAALAAQSQQHSHPLRWITERAPEPRDVYWRNLAISYKIMPFYKIGVIFAASLLTIFFTVPVTAVQGIARFEKLKKWFPPAMAIELIVILNGFIYIVPFAMLGIAKLGGSVSNSKAGMLLLDFIKAQTCGRSKENPYLYSLPYFRVIPLVSLSILIGMVFAVVAPLLLPFLVGYFFLGYAVYINQVINFPSTALKNHNESISSTSLHMRNIPFILQIQDVYETIYDTCGRSTL